MSAPLTVAWFSFFPVEWLSDIPAEVQAFEKLHPASWQRVLLEQFEPRTDLRLHIIVLRKQFPRSFSFERRGVTFHLIKTPGGLRAPTLYWTDTWLIGRVLRKVKPDLVHAWGTEQGAALAAQRLGYPYLVTVQGLYSWCAEIGPVGKHERLSAWIERKCLPRAPLVTTESTFSRDFVTERFHPPRVMQIEHAPAQIFHRVSRKPAQSPARFLFIGRFEPRKGVDVLLRALDQVRSEMDFELVIVGKAAGEFFDRLKQEISPALWERIRFKHNLTAEQIADELAETTMTIYPTLVDVSPNTVKEAVVAGVPVLASRVGGIPDYVIPGQNGLLFEPGNLQSCLTAIREAMRHPLFASGQVEAQALKQMRDYLSLETMGEKFWQAYLAVANRSAGG